MNRPTSVTSAVQLLYGCMIFDVIVDVFRRSFGSVKFDDLDDFYVTVVSQLLGLLLIYFISIGSNLARYVLFFFTLLTAFFFFYASDFEEIKKLFDNSVWYVLTYALSFVAIYRLFKPESNAFFRANRDQQ